MSTYIFALSVTILILFNSTRVSLTYAYYKLDPVGFIEALCVNKDKPELQCNGKCHLNKVLKSHDKDQDIPENVVDFKELLLYTITLEKIVFKQINDLKKQNTSIYKNLYSYNSINDCFHPPQV
ncbi:hypothetical protein [Lacinutrix algicola]|uniref:hypothetical protein n=1 Tax=Lacinutrix algicola TaxID=342954 RepID=UPI00128F9835|nr:hypothetical protein [Lacinutrix algicola]